MAAAAASSSSTAEQAVVLETARTALSRGDVVLAQRSGEEAAAAARDRHDVDGEAAAVDVVTKSLIKKGDLNAAVRVSSECANRFAAAGNRQAQAKMLLLVADVNMAAQDVEGALVFLKKARSISSEAKDIAGEAAVFRKTAKLSATIGDVEEALWSIQRGTALLKKLNDKAGQAELLLISADLSFAKAWGHLAHGNELKFDVEAREALRASELSAKLSEELGDKRNRALALLSLGNAQLMMRNSEGAASTAADALVLCEETSYDSARAGALLLAAGAHLQEGRSTPAEQSASQALVLFRQLRDVLATDAAGEFLKETKKSASQFRGFYLRAVDSFQPIPPEVVVRLAQAPSAGTGRGAAARSTRPVASDCIVFDAEGEPNVFFGGYEGRLAESSAAARQAVARAAAAPEDLRSTGMPSLGPRYRAEVPSVYTVRWQGIQPQGLRHEAASPEAVEGAYFGSEFVDAGPVGAGTYFPPMFKVSTR